MKKKTAKQNLIKPKCEECEHYEKNWLFGKICHFYFYSFLPLNEAEIKCAYRIKSSKDYEKYIAERNKQRR